MALLCVSQLWYETTARAGWQWPVEVGVRRHELGNPDVTYSFRSDIAERVKRMVGNSGWALGPWIAMVILGWCAEPVNAQLLRPRSHEGPFSNMATERPYAFKAWVVSEPQRHRGYLVVEAKLAPQTYLYSLTQSGPSATRIEVALNESFEIDGAFQPLESPHVIEKDPVFGERLEKHLDRVRFCLPIRFTPGAVPEDVRIDVRINGQVCTDDGVCMPIRDTILTAAFGDYRLRTDEPMGKSPAARISDERVSSENADRIRGF